MNERKKDKKKKREMRGEAKKTQNIEKERCWRRKIRNRKEKKGKWENGFALRATYPGDIPRKFWWEGWGIGSPNPDPQTKRCNFPVLRFQGWRLKFIPIFWPLESIPVFSLSDQNGYYNMKRTAHVYLKSIQYFRPKQIKTTFWVKTLQMKFTKTDGENLVIML